MARKKAKEKTSKTVDERLEAVREQRRARRKAARAALRAKICSLSVSSIRFLWERSWTLSIPAAVILALAFGSYSPDDPSFSVSTMSKATNYCGLWGAWTADLMLGVFGLSAWWFVLGFFMVAYFAIRSLVRRHRGEIIPDRIKPPKNQRRARFRDASRGVERS